MREVRRMGEKDRCPGKERRKRGRRAVALEQMC